MYLDTSRKIVKLFYLKNKKIGKTPLNYQSPNEKAYEAIVHYFVKIVKNNKYPKPAFYELRSCINELSNLRNAIAHRYEGISEKILNDTLKKCNSDTTKFNEKLRKYLSMPDKDDFGIYNKINEKIMKLLDA